MVSSLFSWQTVLTVGITLLTLYGDKVVDWVAGLFNAKNVMKPLVDIQQQLNDVSIKRSSKCSIRNNKVGIII